MRLRYHLALFGIVIAAFNALEAGLQQPVLDSSDNLHVVTDFPHRHISQTTNVEGNPDRSNSLLHVDPINNRKRVGDSPDYSSSLPHSDLQCKRRAYQIAPNNAQSDPLFIDDENSVTTSIDLNYPLYGNDLLSDDYLTTASNELASSNPHTSSSAVAQESSKRDSNIASNDHFDLHKNHTPTDGEAQSTLSELALLPPETISIGMNEIMATCRNLDGRRSKSGKPKTTRPTPQSFPELRWTKQTAILSKYFEIRDKQRNELFTYFNKKYKLDIHADLRNNMLLSKFHNVLLLYLLYVEMINTIVPGNHSAQQSIESAYELYGSVAPHFNGEERSTADPQSFEYIMRKWKFPSYNKESYLLWAFLELWLYKKRLSLFDKVKNPSKNGMVDIKFKTYFNHHFISSFDEFSKKVHEAYIKQLGPLHHGSDGESRSILPEQEQSGLKFDEEALSGKASSGPYVQLLKSAMEKQATFPGVLIAEENKIAELVAAFHTTKCQWIVESENPELKSCIKPGENGTKVIRNKILRKIYTNILPYSSYTWLDYFDKTYNLQSQTYRESLPHKSIKTILPTYLFFVEMINIIVPRTDLTKGGTTSAFNSFKSLLESCQKDRLEENNTTHRKFAPGEMDYSSYDRTSPLLWFFLENWLKEGRPTLYSIISKEESLNDLKSSFKSLFLDIFILSFEYLTKKIRESTV